MSFDLNFIQMRSTEQLFQRIDIVWFYPLILQLNSTLDTVWRTTQTHRHLPLMRKNLERVSSVSERWGDIFSERKIHHGPPTSISGWCTASIKFQLQYFWSGCCIWFLNWSLNLVWIESRKTSELLSLQKRCYGRISVRGKYSRL